MAVGSVSVIGNALRLAEPVAVGIVLRNRASSVGDVVGGGENAAGRRSTMLGGGLEARY